ncbi:MAG: cytochrome c [Campylobacterota bacterium]|nr:cytochrome c [Campylobacterota bacterium]
MKKITFMLPFIPFLLYGIDTETLYLKNGCPSCHGFYGQGTGNGPRLQDQKEEVLLKRLLNLQQGITRKPNGTIMVSFAKSLDGNQTKAMAHYLSVIKTSYENREYIDYGEHADGGS